MKTITLIIGGVDVSEYVIASDYSVQKVWKTKTSFENYDGKEISKRSGWNYQLRAGFEDLTDDVMARLTKALDNSNITVVFTDPHSPEENGCTTAIFKTPQNTGGNVTAELDDGLRWETSIDITSIFTAATDGDGL